MNFVSELKFLNQNKKVQCKFIDWWEPSKGDLFAFVDDGYNRKIGTLESEQEIQITKINKGEYRTPLLTMEQLIHFIEDKTNSKLQGMFLNSIRDGYIIIFTKIENRKIEEVINKEIFETDLLEIFWKIAIEIANK